MGNQLLKLNKEEKEKGMMKSLNKSIVLPAFFPNSMEDTQHFLNVIKIISNYGISFIEFYYKGNEKKIIRECLMKYNINSIYLGAMAIKQKGLNLSSHKEKLRIEAVREMKKCIDDAYFYGSYSILINSGRSSDNGKDEIAYEYLKKSLEELLKYIDVSAKDYKLNLTLEPGDIEVDSFSLIGDTDLAIKLVREIRGKYNNFGLTMDTSHLRQLDEEPLNSIKKTFHYCNHIHLANCIVKDKTSKLYGDKHPPFGVKNGEFDLKDIKKIYKNILYINNTSFVSNKTSSKRRIVKIQ